MVWCRMSQPNIAAVRAEEVSSMVRFLLMNLGSGEGEGTAPCDPGKSGTEPAPRAARGGPRTSDTWPFGRTGAMARRLLPRIWHQVYLPLLT